MKEAASVSLQLADGVALIGLERAERMNAFDRSLHAQLSDALLKASGDPAVRAIILTGSGKAFSAGQDLNERLAVFEAGGTPDLYKSLDELYNPLARTIATIPVPVIAAVNGIAFGAGAAIAIGCDIVIAAQSARFQFGFVNVGLGPDSGASWLLPHLVGQPVALDLMLTGRPVSADEALVMGIISRVVADDALLPTAREIAKGLCSASSSAVAAIKRQLRCNPLISFDSALECERDNQAALGRTEGYRAAVLRFARRKG